MATQGIRTRSTTRRGCSGPVDNSKALWWSEESAERDIVGAGFTRLHREMAAVVAGFANLGGGTKQCPAPPHVAVVLPEVDAVRAEALGKGHAVVDDERDCGIGTDPLQRRCEPRDLVLPYVLHSQLERRLECPDKSSRKPILKIRAGRLRADEIETARAAFRWREVSSSLREAHPSQTRIFGSDAS